MHHALATGHQSMHGLLLQAPGSVAHPKQQAAAAGVAGAKAASSFAAVGVRPLLEMALQAASGAAVGRVRLVGMH